MGKFELRNVPCTTTIMHQFDAVPFGGPIPRIVNYGSEFTAGTYMIHAETANIKGHLLTALGHTGRYANREGVFDMIKEVEVHSLEDLVKEFISFQLSVTDESIKLCPRNFSINIKSHEAWEDTNIFKIVIRPRKGVRHAWIIHT